MVIVWGRTGSYEATAPWETTVGVRFSDGVALNHPTELFEEGPATADQPARTRFGVLTTAPNSLVAAAHNRMPALLSAGEAVGWLAKPDQHLLHPAPDNLLVATPVSLRVNSVRNDDPACLMAPPQGGQMPLL
jgi:hypothetical protein